MTVLLRSRSLIRGTFYHNRGEENDKCVITHPPSAASLADWDDDSRREGGGAVDGSPRPPLLPPVVDDVTDLERARRAEAASSRGRAYDEIRGVESILRALSSSEVASLPDGNMPLRHYRAERGDTDEAVRKLRSTLRWREEFGVEDIKRCFDDGGATSPSSSSSPGGRARLKGLSDAIAFENETGKVYCRGYDRQGRAVLYLTPGRENSNDELNNMR
jgi:hypothetical protein